MISLYVKIKSNNEFNLDMTFFYFWMEKRLRLTFLLKQFMVFSILPLKKQTKQTKTVLPQVEFFMFIFWENWRHHDFPSRFTALYLQQIWFTILTYHTVPDVAGRG